MEARRGQAKEYGYRALGPGRIDVGIARFNDRSSLERDVILDPAIFDVSAAQRSASFGTRGWDD